MTEKPTPKQRIDQVQTQNQSQAQSSLLRRPPTAGGPRRIQEEQAPQRPEKSAFKKALPYLIAGGSTGIGIGIGLTNLL